MRSATPKKDEATSQKSEYVYTIRIKCETLDRLHEIAASEYRTVAQKLRLMMEQEIAAYDARNSGGAT